MTSAAPIATAAAWLAATPRAQRSRALVPTLQREFGLSLAEAIVVIRENNLRLARAT